MLLSFLVKLQILVFPDCPGRRILERLTSQIESSLPGVLQVEQIVIDSPEQAGCYDFHGSPTLLVDGRDLDELKRGLPPMFGCRLYDGKPAPDLKWILERLEARMK